MILAWRAPDGDEPPALWRVVSVRTKEAGLSWRMRPVQRDFAKEIAREEFRDSRKKRKRA